MLMSCTSTLFEEGMVKALGMENSHGDPAWPLPNMKPSTEKSFWEWRSGYSFRAEAWCGQKKINGEWATVIVYYVGHSSFIDGGFAVAVFSRYKEERVEYYEWKACPHEFIETNIGRCLHKYTCKLCNKSYRVDSSD